MLTLNFSFTDNFDVRVCVHCSYGSGTTTLQSPTPSSPTGVNENTINFSSEEEEEEATYDEVIE